MDTEKNKIGSMLPAKEELESLLERAFDKLNGGSGRAITSHAVQNSLSTEKTEQNTDFTELPKEASKTPLKASKNGARSSLRMKYEAEVGVIKKSHNGLEGIRLKLGLSKRKISQLLFVDPSAWTRWTNEKGEAPPHIYRALQWYLLLQEKHPELSNSFWLQSVSRPAIGSKEIDNIKQAVLHRIKNETTHEADVTEEVARLEKIDSELIKTKNELIHSKKLLKGLFISQVLMAIGFLVILFLK